VEKSHGRAQQLGHGQQALGDMASNQPRWPAEYAAEDGHREAMQTASHQVSAAIRKRISGRQEGS